MRKILATPWIYILVIIAGSGIKVQKIDYRFFWFDEISTILETADVSGYDLLSTISKDKVYEIKDYRNLIRLREMEQSKGKHILGISGQLSLTPLHYVVLSLWFRLAGDQDTNLRQLSLLFFFMSLPALFLLVKKIFSSKLAAWVAMSLFSISPFIHLHSMQARYPMLCIFLVIINLLLFLKAQEKGRSLWWIAYAITSILMLYSSAITAIVLLGQFIFLLIYRREKMLYFLPVAVLTILAYFPWMQFLYENREEISNALSWHAQISPPGTPFCLLPFHALVLSGALYSPLDLSAFGYLPELLMRWGNGPGIVLMAVSLFVIGLAIVKLGRESSEKTPKLLLIILLVNSLVFLILDIFRQSSASLISHYQFINMLVILIITAQLVAKGLEMDRLRYGLVYLAVLVMGIFSIQAISSDRCWSVPHNCNENICDARLISSAKNSLLITDLNHFDNIGMGSFLAMLNECKSDDLHILQYDGNMRQLKRTLSRRSYSNIFLFYISTPMLEEFSTTFPGQLEKVQKSSCSDIWQLRYRKP